MADLTDLANFAYNLAGKLPGAGNEAAKQVARVVLTDLVRVTPVDTGLALSNWQVSLNAPVGFPIPAFAPSQKGRVKNGVWEHAIDPVITSQANIQPTLDAGNSIIDNKQPGDDIYISNSVEYVPELDRGSSNQAPAGFVDRAIILGQQVSSQVKVI